jgi:hypothetical protein
MPTGDPGQAVNVTVEVRAVPLAVAGRSAVARPRFRLFTGDSVDCGAVGVGADWKPAAPSGAPGEVVWRREWPRFQMSEGAARTINARPHVYVFVGEEEGGALARPWVSHLALDTSALLDGDTAVTACLRSDGGEDGGVAPPCLAYLAVTITLDRPALTPTLRRLLNPLAITLSRVADLPGVVLPEGADARLNKYVEPTRCVLTVAPPGPLPRFGEPLCGPACVLACVYSGTSSSPPFL